MITLTWREVYERLNYTPAGQFYGIPRGGSVVAVLPAALPSFWTAWTVSWIVDDIVVAGPTKEKYTATGK